MHAAELTIDLDAIAGNWRALDACSGASTETAAVVKADAYGLGVAPVAQKLAAEGVRHFFVAQTAEGVALRKVLGPGPVVSVFAGHMDGDAAMLSQADLLPMLNAPEQITRHFGALPNHPFGIQLDTGMNRLGMEDADWREVSADALARKPTLIMSHLACADEPDHAMNALQLRAFHAMTEGIDVPRSLSATGGILLEPEFHFDLVRPGIGLFGGEPFAAADPVVSLSLPVIQTRRLEPGETVGYGASWGTENLAVIATVSSGYADGLIRHMSNSAVLFAGDIPCPLAGRVSMDLLTVDVTHLDEVPDRLDMLCAHQTVDNLATAADTIGYEILTSLGDRYHRRYLGAVA